MTSPLNLPAPAGVRLYTSSCDFAQPCVFVKQLPGPILCASPGGEDPLFRSYRVNLPNSLTMNLPSALVYSTRLRVSVCGTGACALEFSGFSREYDYPRCCSPRMDRILSGSPRTVDLPADLNGYTLQRPFPSGRGGFTAPSPRHTHSQ